MRTFPRIKKDLFNYEGQMEISGNSGVRAGLAKQDSWISGEAAL
jgi:hypothetical protein